MMPASPALTSATTAVLANAAARFTAVDPAAVLSSQRGSAPVLARQMAMTAARRAGYTYSAIARAFDRQHPAVMHAVRLIESRATTDATLQKALADLTQIARARAYIAPGVSFTFHLAGAMSRTTSRRGTVTSPRSIMLPSAEDEQRQVPVERVVLGLLERDGAPVWLELLRYGDRLELIEMRRGRDFAPIETLPISTPRRQIDALVSDYVRQCTPTGEVRASQHAAI